MKLFLKISLTVFYVLAAGLLELILLNLGLIPEKIILGIGLIQSVLLIILCLEIFIPRSPNWLKTIGIMTMILLILAYIVGGFYSYKTQVFMGDISNSATEHESYVLIVNKDSKVEDISQISKPVKILNQNDDRYQKAQKKLIADYPNINFTEDKSLIELGLGIIKGKTESIFISEQLELLLEEQLPKFKDNFKVLEIVDMSFKIDTIASTYTGIQPFNVFISGIDCLGNINEVGRSDVNMLITVNPTTHEILLTSIPRDYYVFLPTKNAYDKITHTGLYGIKDSTFAVENLLNTKIDYYIKVNFTTVRNMIDAIGGIDVNSKYSFTTSGRFNNGYKFKKGKNHLNGKQALAFARERYAFTDGDRQRIKDQQIVMEAVINKVVTDRSLLAKYPQILNSMSDYISTNVPNALIKEMISSQLSNMAGWEIKKFQLDGSGKTTTVFSCGSQAVYVMEPFASTVLKSQNEIYDYLSRRTLSSTGTANYGINNAIIGTTMYIRYPVALN